MVEVESRVGAIEPPPRPAFPEAWLAEWADLRRMAERFRCRICYELLAEPVMTVCGHNFCSLCLRSYLNYQPQCPECYQPNFERDLRPNRDLKEVLHLLTTLILPRIQSLRDWPDPPDPSPSAVQPPAGPVTVPPSPDPAPTGACPVCQVAVPAANLNRHLDRCLQPTGQPAAAPRPTAHPSPNAANAANRPLQKVVYHLLKDSELRKRLRAEGLAAQGLRAELILRHQRFSVLWNTNCQSENPLPKMQIVMQAQKAEKCLKKVQATIIKPPQLNFTRNTDVKLIEAQTRDYIQVNRGQFSDLVARARQTWPPAESSAIPTTSRQACVGSTPPPTNRGVVEPAVLSPDPGRSGLLDDSRDTSLIAGLDRVTLVPSPSVVRSPLYVTPKRKSARQLRDDLSPKRLKQNNIRASLQNSRAGLKRSSCPVCRKSVPQAHVNAHLDRCLRLTEGNSEDEFLDSAVAESDSDGGANVRERLRHLPPRSKSSRCAEMRSSSTAVPSSRVSYSDEDLFMASDEARSSEKENVTSPYHKGKGIGKKSTRSTKANV